MASRSCSQLASRNSGFKPLPLTLASRNLKDGVSALVANTCRRPCSISAFSVVLCLRACRFAFSKSASGSSIVVFMEGWFPSWIWVPIYATMGRYIQRWSPWSTGEGLPRPTRVQLTECCRIIALSVRQFGGVGERSTTEPRAPY